MKRFISAFLSLCVVAGMLCAGMVPVSAEGADISVDFTDAKFKAAVYEVLGKNPGDPITAEECAEVTELSAAQRGIKNLEGLEHFVSLETLDCRYNEITSLDVTNQPKLQVLYFAINAIDQIDLTHNPLLTDLWSYSTGLTELDLTQNPLLEELDCSFSPLARLDFSNNPLLRTLVCDDTELTELDVTEKPLLDYLSCSRIPLGRLDVTKNPQLTYLDCYAMQLTELNVTKNPLLEYLRCEDNELTTLDLTQNTKLKYLEVRQNKFTSPKKILGLDALQFLGWFDLQPQKALPAPPWPQWESKWFATADEAARDFALTYMAFQLTEGVEFGTSIYRKFNWKTFKLGYSYAEPIRGTEENVLLISSIWMLLCPFLYAADIHTHPYSDNFSDPDLKGAAVRKFLLPWFQYSYVSSPNGELRRYTPKTKTNEVIYKNLDYFAKYE